MNYSLFCHIVNENLVYASSFSDEDRKEELHDMYVEYKEVISGYEMEVLEWLRNHLADFSLDTHRYALKITPVWVRASDAKPPTNVGVLVYLPREDNHITSGMWDVSEGWVLLDEYRLVPEGEVTHWQLLPQPPQP